MGKYKSISYTLDKINNIELVICNFSTLSYPLHNHISAYTISMILSGTIIFTINDKSFFYEATQGERYKIFVIPPYVPHSIQAISRYSMVSICTDKKIINMISHTQLRADVIDLLSRTINLDIEKQDQIMQCLNELISYHNNLCAPKTIFIDNLRKQLEEFPEQ